MARRVLSSEVPAGFELKHNKLCPKAAPCAKGSGCKPRRKEHDHNCPRSRGCSCIPTGIRARVYNPVTKKDRPTAWRQTLKEAERDRGVLIAKIDREVTERKASLERGEDPDAIRDRTVTEPFRDVVPIVLADMTKGVARTRRGKKYKTRTVGSHETVLRLHIIPRIGDRRIPEIEREHLNEVVEGMLEEGYAPGTIRGALRAVGTVLRRARDKDKAYRAMANPLEDLVVPADDIDVQDRLKPGETIATRAQMLSLLAVLGGHPAAHLFWALALFSGLRLSELLGLTWSKIDLAQGIIKVDEQWSRAEGRGAPTKSGKTRRVRISRRLHDVLSAALAKREASDARLKAAGRHVPTGDRHVLEVRPGQHYRSVPHLQATRGLWAAAGLPVLSPHGARHSWVTSLIYAGVNLVEVSRQAGHSTVQITVDIYGHFIEEQGEKTTHLVDQHFDEVTLAETEEHRLPDLPTATKSGRQATPATVANAVLTTFQRTRRDPDLTLDDLFDSTRDNVRGRSELLWPRQLAVYVARLTTPATEREIAMTFARTARSNDLRNWTSQNRRTAHTKLLRDRSKRADLDAVLALL